MLFSTGNLEERTKCSFCQTLQTKVNYNRPLIYAIKIVAALCAELLTRENTKLGTSENSLQTLPYTPIF